MKGNVWYWPRSTVNNSNLFCELRENYSQVGYFRARNDLSIKVKMVSAVSATRVIRLSRPTIHGKEESKFRHFKCRGFVVDL